MMGRTLNLLALAGTMLMSQPAWAATQVFTLGASDPAAGLGSGPFGTVTVTENGNGTLTFTESLYAGFKIHASNSTHNALAFNIAGDPAITFTGLPGGFDPVAATSGSSVTSPPFGSFNTALACNAACGSGFAGGYSGPLTFTVGRTDLGALSIASLTFNTVSGVNYYFTSDIINANGNTGNVGATRNAGAVPEPATWAMMLVGFGAMGVSMRRRRPVALGQAA